MGPRRGWRPSTIDRDGLARYGQEVQAVRHVVATAIGGSSHLAIAAALASLVACGDQAVPAPAAGADGHVLVVGIVSDLEVGVDIARLHATLRANGAPVLEEEVKVGGGEPFEFPRELRFPALPEGTEVDVALEAFAGALPSEPPLLSRLASTRIVAGASKLMRLRLERECSPTSSSRVR